MYGDLFKIAQLSLCVMSHFGRFKCIIYSKQTKAECEKKAIYTRCVCVCVRNVFVCVCDFFLLLFFTKTYIKAFSPHLNHYIRNPRLFSMQYTAHCDICPLNKPKNDSGEKIAHIILQCWVEWLAFRLKCIYRLNHISHFGLDVSQILSP